MDWHGLMKVGLHQLGLLPSDFWELTPAELSMMVGAERSSSPMLRDQLDTLARAFPDQKTGD